MDSSDTQVVDFKPGEKTQKNTDPQMIFSDKTLPPSSTSSSFTKLLEGVVMAATAADSSTHSPVELPALQISSADMQSESKALVQLPQEEVDKLDSNQPAYDVPRTPNSDGYSWRKYGQKQVKSTGSLRSYYRCTNYSCCARKKVQHVDLSGDVIDVIYKGNHNHDPPPNLIKGFGRKRHSCDSSVQVVRLNYECHDSKLNTSVTTCPRDVEEHHTKTPDTNLRLESEPLTLRAEVVHGKSNSFNDLDSPAKMNERDIPIKKRRVRDDSRANPEHVYRTFKEPKIVVHAAGDAGIIADGYRWRKYGQKMVKGNLHPRSYYRCSTVGCPVRKHVEKASDGSLAMVAIYEGEHNHEMPAPKKQPSAPKSSTPVKTSSDAANSVLLLKMKEESSSPARVSHDDSAEEMISSDKGANSPAMLAMSEGEHNHEMPVPKKQHSSPNCSIPINTSPIPVNNNLFLKPKEESRSPNRVSSSQQSGDNDNDSSEEKVASEKGAEKVLESAHTILNIGIELKSC